MQASGIVPLMRLAGNCSGRDIKSGLVGHKSGAFIGSLGEFVTGAYSYARMLIRDNDLQSCVQVKLAMILR